MKETSVFCNSFFIVAIKKNQPMFNRHNCKRLNLTRSYKPKTNSERPNTAVAPMNNKTLKQTCFINNLAYIQTKIFFQKHDKERI